ncbi:hypothetical protein [Lentibacillus amyloliquefaciens]|uniref:Aminodeoxychorismate lyase n=1 Tax=Lentibacillus amyloliquefaciens TaxID=1472767 RepID=A0A0U4G5Y2_9BACI|nr:hypothetical protein [Lentibacillus amyloliquefaciens]ALX48090.1 hypothetical protein AOX59_05395 [Lentibacillus amyloliquefaciens]
MKQTIRSFAIGLLTASLVLLGVFYFADYSQSETQSNLSTEEMIETVESEGYHVLTESEYISVSVQSDNNSETADNEDSSQENTSDEADTNENNNTEEEQEENSEDAEETDQTSYTLTIESGVIPSEVSQTLEDNNIIDDAESFTTFMEDEEYSQLIQLGEFELSSDMDHNEIAETITN